MLNPSPAPRRDYTGAARAVVVASVLLLLAWGIGHWAWNQPFLAAPRALARLTSLPPTDAIPVPVQGVKPRAVADTFGAPRGNGRRHAGLDIFAPRGTPVLSASEGVVVSIRDSGLGGKQVWILGPGGERYYYAHLDAWEPLLRTGDTVRAGSVLGTVGDTGNARGTPPHLHFGIYTANGAVDPLPRLRAQASGEAITRGDRPSPAGSPR